MKAISNKKYKSETVVMDGIHFLKCTFTKCTLVYSGDDFGWQDCIFTEVQLSFIGAAERAMKFAGLFKLLKEKTDESVN